MIRSVMSLILASAVLIGCAPKPVEIPAPVYRDPSAQIASQTNVTAGRLAGAWTIRQRFAGEGRFGDTFTLTALPDDALQVSFPRQICVDGECSDVVEPLILLEKTGPGRWMPVDPPRGWPDAEMWVMWMDFDDRTAALGTPSGEFGWIIDKSATGGADRIIAARDIMEWFGYDMARLNEVAR